MSKAIDLIIICEGYKKKPLPKEVSKEISFIKSEIKQKGFVEVVVDLGGDAYDYYAVVPLEKAEDLDKGHFDFPSYDLGDDKVFIDNKKGYAWMYLGVLD